MLHSALIGYTGFVGSNLDSDQFSFRYNSSNISEMSGKSFDTVVCAGVQAKKWWANQNPEADWAGISFLWDVLSTVSAKRFFLISTVDVFPCPVGVVEGDVPGGEMSPYGRHRLQFENLVSARFSKGGDGSLLEEAGPSCFILRLPGLFGQGLKKNVLFDLLHGNLVENLDPTSSFQYYDLEDLSSDMARMRDLKIPLLNLATAPLSTGEIVSRFFPEKVSLLRGSSGGKYDFHSQYWEHWPESDVGYLYGKGAILARMGKFFATQKGDG